jgi:hypothetical protein
VGAETNKKTQKTSEKRRMSNLQGGHWLRKANCATYGSTFQLFGRIGDSADLSYHRNFEQHTSAGNNKQSEIGSGTATVEAKPLPY